MPNAHVDMGGLFGADAGYLVRLMLGGVLGELTWARQISESLLQRISLCPSGPASPSFLLSSVE